MRALIMLKYIILTLLISSVSFAGSKRDFEGGSEEFSDLNYADMTPAGIQKLIQQEIKTHCDDDGLCKIFGIETHTSMHWTMSFNTGEGSNNSSGSGSVYYIGGSSPSSGSGKYWGATLTVYGPVTCEASVKVDPSVYRLIKSYMYNNIKQDGKVPRDLTDAEKTVLMFYGKIIEKVSACQSGGR